MWDLTIIYGLVSWEDVVGYMNFSDGEYLDRKRRLGKFIPYYLLDFRI